MLCSLAPYMITVTQSILLEVVNCPEDFKICHRLTSVYVYNYSFCFRTSWSSRWRQACDLLAGQLPLADVQQRCILFEFSNNPLLQIYKIIMKRYKYPFKKCASLFHMHITVCFNVYLFRNCVSLYHMQWLGTFFYDLLCMYNTYTTGYYCFSNQGYINS